MLDTKACFRERIIEYCLPSNNDNKLVTKTVQQFVLSVGDRSPAPGEKLFHCSDWSISKIAASDWLLIDKLL